MTHTHFSLFFVKECFNDHAKKEDEQEMPNECIIVLGSMEQTAVFQLFSNAKHKRSHATQGTVDSPCSASWAIVKGFHSSRIHLNHGGTFFIHFLPET